MMIIPGLKTAGDAAIESHMVRLRNCLGPFAGNVAYVDLNVRLNLLWISAKPVPGLTRLLVEAIRKVIPEARVVTADFNPDAGKRTRFRDWRMRLSAGIQRSVQLIARHRH